MEKKGNKKQEAIVIRQDVSSFDDCLNVIKKDYKALATFPEEFVTKDLCLMAVRYNYMALKYFPRKILNKDMYMRCFEIDWRTMVLFPNNLKTLDLYKSALKRVTFSPSFIEQLKSDKYIHVDSSEDFQQFHILRCISLFWKDFPLDDETMCLEREKSLRTRNSYYDLESKVFTVLENYYGSPSKIEFSNFADFYHYLEGNLVGSNLIDYDFEGIDISSYNLEGAHLSGALLDSLGRYDDTFYSSFIRNKTEELPLPSQPQNIFFERTGLSLAGHSTDTLNNEGRRMYYITDMHLNHWLLDCLPKRATYEEICFYIQKYIKKMLKNVWTGDKNDYLLIGGDVASNFEISKIFYAELVKQFNPSNIVAILGNHELWSYEDDETSIEHIVEQYSNMLGEMGINFLHNSLLIVKPTEKKILSQSQILNMSAEELQRAECGSNLMIYGSVGFSGYNAEFNASHGLYKHTVASITADLKYTRENETTYNKLREVFAEDKLIVLTHTPHKDWSSTPFVPKWVYVNGHTHRNHYIESNECVVYADNQIGYCAKRVGLKYFQTSFRYDIFKYYFDGVYSISKDQYIDFNNGNGTKCSLSREVDEIIMIKRCGLYMFFMEDKKSHNLFLLNGGATKRLSNRNLSYYFINMSKYAEYIKRGITDYNDALKNISKMVKAIGGDGTVHGSIVDIGFSCHLFLNPQNFNLTAYYSFGQGEMKQYSSVSALLQAKRPNMYKRYVRMVGNIQNPTLNKDLDRLERVQEYVANAPIYKLSNATKRLQYISEHNIIRIWNDDFINNYEQYIRGNKQLME